MNSLRWKRVHHAGMVCIVGALLGFIYAWSEWMLRSPAFPRTSGEWAAHFGALQTWIRAGNYWPWPVFGAVAAVPIAYAIRLMERMRSYLGERAAAYLDEVVVPSDFDEDFGPTQEWTRRDVLVFRVVTSPIWLLVFIFFALLFSLSLWPFLLIGIWSSAYDTLQASWVARIFAFGALMLLGWGMYKLREANRQIYGIGEICVGSSMCWFGVNAATPNALPSIIAMAGGVYVIVRGLDNYAQGKKTSVQEFSHK
jgi:hypothetical protein